MRVRVLRSRLGYMEGEAAPFCTLYRALERLLVATVDSPWSLPGWSVNLLAIVEPVAVYRRRFAGGSVAATMLPSRARRTVL